MKRYIKSLALMLAAVAVCASCSKDEGAQTNEAAGSALVIAPSMGGTRAVNYSIDTYFGLAGYEKATVTVGSDYAAYELDGGLLVAASGNNPFYFPADGSPLASVKVMWPEWSKRASMVPADQSAEEAFLTSDWISAELTNVLPTTKLPVQFKHENAKIAFKLSNGAKLESLTVAGYSAYCDTTKDEAQLMLQPAAVAADVPVKAGDTGVLKIEGEASTRTFSITDFPTALAAGQNYTITLNVQ